MCQIHKVDVFKDGKFDRPSEDARTRQIPSDAAAAEQFWDDLQKPVSVYRSHHVTDANPRYLIAGCEPPRPGPFRREHYLERAANIGCDVRGL